MSAGGENMKRIKIEILNQNDFDNVKGVYKVYEHQGELFVDVKTKINVYGEEVVDESLFIDDLYLYVNEEKNDKPHSIITSNALDFMESEDYVVLEPEELESEIKIFGLNDKEIETIKKTIDKFQKELKDLKKKKEKGIEI